MSPFYIIGVTMLIGSILLPHERTARAIAITGFTCLILAFVLTL